MALHLGPARILNEMALPKRMFTESNGKALIQDRTTPVSEPCELFPPSSGNIAAPIDRRAVRLCGTEYHSSEPIGNLVTRSTPAQYRKGAWLAPTGLRMALGHLDQATVRASIVAGKSEAPWRVFLVVANGIRTLIACL